MTDCCEPHTLVDISTWFRHSCVTQIETYRYRVERILRGKRDDGVHNGRNGF